MDSARASIFLWYCNATDRLIAAASEPEDGKFVDREASSLRGLLRRQAQLVLKLYHQGPSKSVKKELLPKRLEDLASISMSKFYAYRYDQVPYRWRQIYTDTLILTTFHDILGFLDAKDWLQETDMDKIVENLDRAMITAGGAGVLGTTWIEKTLTLLERLDREVRAHREGNKSPQKQMKTEKLNKIFSAHEPYGRPLTSTKRLCPRHRGWSLIQFEAYMNASTHPRPVVFTDLVSSWPALTDRPWKSPDYLLDKTFQGRRLVPVEVGRSYVDQGWGQEIIPFKEFLSKYIEPKDFPKTQIGYLAQHNLFHQIPSLRADTAIPDFCWSSVPGHPSDEKKNQKHLEMPLLNAWFGPARTITPLHTDGYHNLLVQVVGTKYVRLYPPWEECMRPKGTENGVDMSNTSELDVGVLEGWDEAPWGNMSLDEKLKVRRELRNAEYWECILEEGDALLIPIGWWHYVRSLSVSFSVSFWWN